MQSRRHRINYTAIKNQVLGNGNRQAAYRQLCARIYEADEDKEPDLDVLFGLESEPDIQEIRRKYKAFSQKVHPNSQNLDGSTFEASHLKPLIDCFAYCLI